MGGIYHFPFRHRLYNFPNTLRGESRRKKFSGGKNEHKRSAHLNITEHTERKPMPDRPNENEIPIATPTELMGAFTEVTMLVAEQEQKTQNFHSQMVIKGIVAELIGKVEAIKKEFGVDGGVAVVTTDEGESDPDYDRIINNKLSEIRSGNKRILLN